MKAQTKSPHFTPDDLTPEQWEALVFYARGYSFGAIAKAMLVTRAVATRYIRQGCWRAGLQEKRAVVYKWFEYYETKEQDEALARVRREANPMADPDL